MTIPASYRLRTALAIAGLTAFPLCAQTPTTTPGPGRGQTGAFEIEFLQSTIDHHFAELRMTELAAGTDSRREDIITGDAGTAPTQGYPATQPKSNLPDVKSLARQNNAVAREQILKMQNWLKTWYGITYTPQTRTDAQSMIGILDQAQIGSDFNHKFLEVFSRFDFIETQPLNGCIAGSDQLHTQLRDLCIDIWHTSMTDIEAMRHALELNFNITDYQPFDEKQPLQTQTGSPTGHHTSPEPVIK